MQYIYALWTKTFRCPRVYDEYVLKKTFVEGLLFLIKHRMQLFCSNRNHVTLHKLEYDSTSLTRVQEAAGGVHKPNSNRSPQTLTSRRQVVIRVGDEVASMQNRRQAEEEEQSP